MEATTFDPLSMTFSDAAARKARALIEEESNEKLNLRVFVTGGGCSGFDVEDDDTQIEKEGVALLIDALSFQYLAGSVINYKEDLQGSRFVVENPNAVTTCGCGNSFSI